MVLGAIQDCWINWVCRHENVGKRQALTPTWRAPGAAKMCLEELGQ